MSVQRRPRLLAAVAIALCTIAVPAAAQLVTGSVAGTVNDPTGAVIPGATVTLISETRGTRLPEVVTSTNGDFVVPNVTADRYTVRVTMDGFKTLERTGVSVSAGDRQGLGSFVIEVGGVSETVVGQERSAGHPGEQRRALVHDPDRARSRTCRSPTAASPRSPRSRPASRPPATRRASAAAATPTS